jgi:branched-chain amino acid transport system ATP-binding protein
MKETVLEVNNVSKFFGGLKAVSNISLKVEKGEIKGLIGPNGAGKTTLLNVISAVYHPAAGEISFKGHSITKLPSHKIAALGIARTFQHVRLFSLDLSVLENAMIGRHVKTRTGLLDVFFPWPNVEIEYKQSIEEAKNRLQSVGLLSKAAWSVNSLTFADQRALELARTLAMEPELLLLDEPAAGLDDTEAAGLAKRIRKLRDELGLTIILVEHNMKVVMTVCDEILVMNNGQRLAEGTPKEIQNNLDVVGTYLGG